jgi:hypothetical protein
LLPSPSGRVLFLSRGYETRLYQSALAINVPFG